MGNKLTLEYVKEEYAKKGFEFLDNEYNSSKFKHNIKCLKHNIIWKQKYNSLQCGYGCPECAKEKTKKTFLMKYGVEIASKSKEVKEKTKQTMFKKYGGYPQQNKQIQEKSKQTCINKYGVENIFQNDLIKKKSQQTCLEYYGVDNYSKTKEFKNNFKQACLEKYGVENPFQNEKIKEKIKQTCLERYGIDSHTKIKEVKEKIQQTCMERYGTKNPSQNYEIALRAARKVNHPELHYHWLTGEELVCQGSYESAVVYHLNNLRINYLWQPEVFKLSTGRTYRPDFYLVDEDKWIEIKGYFRKDALDKWNEFHNIIKPNSELWNKDKLKEMAIL
jgi:hypothetical protein